ncbi:MAG: sensor histidine kinase [Leadbetterella sp.]
MSKFWLIACFIFFYTPLFSQKSSFSESFLASQAIIESKFYDNLNYEKTLGQCDSLYKSAKNNLERGVALRIKAQLLINSSNDIHIKDIALPIALESCKILLKESDDKALKMIFLVLSNVYIAEYKVKQSTKKELLFAKYSMILSKNPGFRPKIDFKDAYSDRYASKDELMQHIKLVESKIISKTDYRSKMYRSHTLAGKYFFATDNFDISDKLFKKALSYADSCNDQAFKFIILRSYIDIATKAKRYEIAIVAGEMGLKLPYIKNNELRKGPFANLLYLAYKGAGNLKKAYEYKDISIEIADKLHRETEQKRNQLLLERNLDLEKQNLLQAEVDKQKNTKWILGIYLAVLLIGLCILLFYYRNLKKKNKEISEAMLKGQTIERKRVAMDLHDNLGSTLSALWMSLDAMDTSRLSQNEKTVYLNLHHNLEKAYNDVRLLAHNLLPQEFEEKGLVYTLGSFVENLNASTHIKFELDISPKDLNLPKNIEFELYSICLELGNNILKHSKAQNAKIRLIKEQRQVTLKIEDDGIGRRSEKQGGRGLKNVETRVNTIEGKWRSFSGENQGLVHEISIEV